MTTERTSNGNPKWQLRSVQPERELFDILKDPNGGVWLSTVLLPSIDLPGLKELYEGQQYETCLFGTEESNVLERYATEEEAREGHERYRIQYGLK